MTLAYKDMSPEQKAKHYERTEKYRKANMEKSSESSRRYYHNNKESCAARAKAWREANKEYVLSKQKLDKRNRKLWAIEFLGGKCNKCQGEFHPSIYEFHHIDPTTKDRDPSKMLQLSLKKLTTELEKCELLCANCHRLTHHGEIY